MDTPGIEGYTLLAEIGEGATGTVYHARRDDGIECAIKVLHSMAVNRDVLDYTFQRIASLRRPEEILTVYEYDIVGSPLFVSMPLMGDWLEDGTFRSHDLGSLCGRLPEHGAWSLLGPIASGMAFLHKNGVVHCDIKPSNIFCEETDAGLRPRIADLALGWLGGVHRLELETLLPYMAPEQLGAPEKVFDGAGLRWDVYGFGVLAYQLLTGQLPRCAGYIEQARAAHDPHGVGIPFSVDADDFFQTLREQEAIVWPAAPEGPGDAERRAVVERCLALDPAERWVDLREVDQAFTAIDHELEAARLADLAERERRRQRGKLVRARSFAAIVSLSLIGACAYGIWKTGQLFSSRQELAETEEHLKGEIEQRDVEIVGLEEGMAKAKTVRDEALAQFREARTQTDGLLSAILDPRHEDVELLTEEQLFTALAFYEDREKSLSAALAEGGELSESDVYDLYNLALLRRRTGDSEGALEALRRVQEQTGSLAATEISKEARIGCLTRAARAGFAEYEILRDRSDEKGALDALRKSNASFAELILEGERHPDILHQHALVNLKLGMKYRELGKYDEAGNAQAQVVRLLQETLNNGESNAAINATLVESEYELGRVRRLQGDRDTAIQFQLAVVESILPLLEVDVATDDDRRILAFAYTELGEMVTSAAGPQKGLIAHNQAVALLKDLLARSPSDGLARYGLARNYGELAAYDRDAGQREEAIRKQEISVGLLDGLVAEVGEDSLTPPAFRLESARQKTSLAELLGDADKTGEAIRLGDGALALLEALRAEGVAVPPAVRKKAALARAQVFGILGHNTEKAGDTKTAAVHFQHAVDQWKSLAEGSGESGPQESGEIKQGLEWSQNRLARLSN